MEGKLRQEGEPCVVSVCKSHNPNVACVIFWPLLVSLSLSEAILNQLSALIALSTGLDTRDFQQGGTQEGRERRTDILYDMADELEFDFEVPYESLLGANLSVTASLGLTHISGSIVHCGFPRGRFGSDIERTRPVTASSHMKLKLCKGQETTLTTLTQGPAPETQTRFQ